MKDCKFILGALLLFALAANAQEVAIPSMSDSPLAITP
jgi:hypothetical protein